jgi:hypothetical protein
MFGVKINQFDNSDGTIESFNGIFPNTPICGEGGFVEILDIVDKGKFNNDVYVRYVSINGEIEEFDFGKANFLNNEDFLLCDRIRFKYFAKDLKGKIIGVAFNMDDLAKQLKCDVGVIKNRLVKNVDEKSYTPFKFNVTKIEL